MPRLLYTLLALALPLAFCSAVSAEEKTKLFNGKDLEGWTYHLRSKTAKMDDVWSVKDGVIICTGRPAGYIRTKESYKNFELTLEWRWAPGKKPGNSGVLLRTVGEDKVWPKSVEAQLMSGNAGDIYNIGEFKMKTDAARTKGRRTQKLKASSEKKPGEWNRYRIIVNGGELKLYVNDELQNEASEVEEIAGKIGLQSEGAEIHFRNIELKPLGK